MEEILASCGLICQTCPIYLATREKDEKRRYKMRVDIAQQIKKHYGQECKPQDVGDCDGCKAESGRLFCESCEIRQCASQKGLENCAHCSEYACEKLEEFFVKDPEAKGRLDVVRSTL